MTLNSKTFVIRIWMTCYFYVSHTTELDGNCFETTLYRHAYICVSVILNWKGVTYWFKTFSRVAGYQYWLAVYLITNWAKSDQGGKGTQAHLASVWSPILIYQFCPSDRLPIECRYCVKRLYCRQTFSPSGRASSYIEFSGANTRRMISSRILLPFDKQRWNSPGNTCCGGASF